MRRILHLAHGVDHRGVVRSGELHESNGQYFIKSCTGYGTSYHQVKPETVPALKKEKNKGEMENGKHH
jgi:hypothetical protein